MNIVKLHKDYSEVTHYENNMDEVHFVFHDNKLIAVTRHKFLHDNELYYNLTLMRDNRVFRLINKSFINSSEIGYQTIRPMLNDNLIEFAVGESIRVGMFKEGELYILNKIMAMLRETSHPKRAE